MIYYIQHDKIDITKWDSTVNSALNSNIFSYYWFLNLASNNHWDAIIENDYETIMPLPFKTTLGIKQVYIPQLIPFLGLYSKRTLTQERIKLFIEKAQKHFFSINYKLSKYCNINKSKKLKINKIPYLSKDLIFPYEKQLKTYTLNAQKKISYSKKLGYYFNDKINIQGIVNFMIEQNFFHDLTQAEIIKNILNITKEKHKLIFNAIYNKDSELKGIAIYLKNKNVISLWQLIISSNLPPETKILISYSLIDNFIQNYSNKNIIFNICRNNFMQANLNIEELGFRTFYYINLNYNKLQNLFILKN